MAKQPGPKEPHRGPLTDTNWDSWAQNQEEKSGRAELLVALCQAVTMAALEGTCCIRGTSWAGGTRCPAQGRVKDGCHPA